eukprot:1150177-Rhodomonas_salina.1
MHGTDILDARCVVLGARVALCSVRYWPSARREPHTVCLQRTAGGREGERESTKGCRGAKILETTMCRRVRETEVEGGRG